MLSSRSKFDFFGARDPRDLSIYPNNMPMDLCFLSRSKYLRTFIFTWPVFQLLFALMLFRWTCVFTEVPCDSTGPCSSFTLLTNPMDLCSVEVESDFYAEVIRLFISMCCSCLATSKNLKKSFSGGLVISPRSILDFLFSSGPVNQLFFVLLPMDSCFPSRFQIRTP